MAIDFHYIWVNTEIMVTVIKKGAGKKDLEKALKDLKSAKEFDAYKYLNTVKLNKSPIEIQNGMRDEWK